MASRVVRTSALSLAAVSGLAVLAAMFGMAESARGVPPAAAAAKLPEAAAPAPSIDWQSGTFAPQSMGTVELERSLSRLAAGSDKHILVQCDALPDAAGRAELAASGIKLLRYVGGCSYYAAIDGPIGPGALARGGRLRWAGPIQLPWKLHPLLAAGAAPPWAIVSRPGRTDLRVAVYVLFHPDVPLTPDAEILATNHGAVVRSEMRSLNGLVLELPLSEVAAVAAADAVQWIEPPLPPLSMVNDSSRALTQADEAQGAPYNLDGSGVTVMVYDGGTIHSHPDLAERLTICDTVPTHAHSTHVAGTVGGSGAESGGLYRGMAPQTELLSYAYTHTLFSIILYADPGDMEADYSDAIANRAADIATNSIGSNVCSNGFSCDITGNYGVTDALIDQIVRGGLGRPFRVIWANGNERSCDRCREEGETTPEGYHSTAPPACAKNHIAVGAVNSNDDSITYFTSWGPSDDGRIKPDIVAPGSQSDGDLGVTSDCRVGDQYSAIYPCIDEDGDSWGYRALSGTSMATPTVAGLAALVLQDFRAQYPGRPDPRNSTLKVLFTHNAADLGNPGPDYQSGYGSVRVRQTVDFLRSGSFYEAEVDQGGSSTFLVICDGSEPQLKLTLAWDDAPGVPAIVPSLVNDLDLRVYDPSGAQHFPWTLDPDNPGAAAVRTTADHVNNIEQVAVDAPMPGLWRIEVAGAAVPEGPQVFSLAATPMLRRDCDADLLPDDEEIALDPTLDCTGNGLLDVCEPDCNGNGIADSCDIAQGASDDCDENGVPDECQPDCNLNGVADVCDIAAGTSTDCDADGTPDECQDTSADCNENGVWDACDISSGTSADINHNGVPDECESGGNVYYVADCTSAGDGSYANPFCTIAEGLVAAFPGDTVIVRDGVYSGFNNVALQFYGKDLVLRSENGPEHCIIDCEGAARAFSFPAPISPAARVEGFTIENGYDWIWGAAIFCDGGSPVISDCVFRNNDAGGFFMGSLGAGICVRNHGVATVRDCRFEGNQAGAGPGVYILPGNSAVSRVERCTFLNNSAGQFGGAAGVQLSTDLNPSVTFSDCLFAYNTAFSDDPTQGYGGALVTYGSLNVGLQNCTFGENAVTRTGGAVAVTNSTALTAENCIFWNNSAPAGGQVSVGIPEAGGSLAISYCEIQGGADGVVGSPVTWGAGNMNLDPLYWDEEGLPDFHLRPGSPCIDGGRPDYTGPPDDWDLDGQPRVLNGRIDIGADEFPPDCNGNGVPDYLDIASGASRDCQPNGVPDECEPDADQDGVPDECDICPGTGAGATVLENGCRAGDLNCDGSVNVFDIDPFVLALTDPAEYEIAYPGCSASNGDGNCDGVLNVADIDPFVLCLTATCPPCP